MDNREHVEIEEFIASLEDYQPTIPDEVTTYYLNRTGFVCNDVKMKRLIALAAQKFISDISNDALQYCKIRQQASGSRDRSKKEKKLILTMEDLSQALKEYGINLRKPDYFADKLSAGLAATVNDSSSTSTQHKEKEKEKDLKADAPKET